MHEVNYDGAYTLQSAATLAWNVYGKGDAFLGVMTTQSGVSQLEALKQAVELYRAQGVNVEEGLFVELRRSGWLASADIRS